MRAEMVEVFAKPLPGIGARRLDYSRFTRIRFAQ